MPLTTKDWQREGLGCDSQSWLVHFQKGKDNKSFRNHTHIFVPSAEEAGCMRKMSQASKETITTTLENMQGALWPTQMSDQGRWMALASIPCLGGVSPWAAVGCRVLGLMAPWSDPSGSFDSPQGRGSCGPGSSCPKSQGLQGRKEKALEMPTTCVNPCNVLGPAASASVVGGRGERWPGCCALQKMKPLCIIWGCFKPSVLEESWGQSWLHSMRLV